MSLMDALLVEPAPFEVWIAYRTDGVAGSGTASDPFDGSPRYNPAKGLTALSKVGSIATATTQSGETWTDGDAVRIEGVAGSALWSGTFVIFGVSGNTFQYQMAGTPSESSPGISGATAAKVAAWRFDEVMNSVGARTTVHLGPTPDGLPFLTQGHADGVTGRGWQIKASQRIVRSGMDVTVLRLVAAEIASKHFYAVGHALASGGQPTRVDCAEVSELTVDCNLTIRPQSPVACGAVRLMGHHARIRRVRAVNWGTNATSPEGRVLSVVTGDRSAQSQLVEVTGSGIEDCLALQPAVCHADGVVSVLHAGPVGDDAFNAQEAYGQGPFIRHCFVDCGPAWVAGKIRAISICWCRGGVVEGNRVHNTYAGLIQHARSSFDAVVRGNHLKNVRYGFLFQLGQMAASPSSVTLSKDLSDTSGKTVKVEGASGHHLLVGERVKVNATVAEYAGLFTVSEVVDDSTFKYRTEVVLPAPPGSGSSFQKIVGASRLLIERNIIEVPAEAGADFPAIELNDNDAASAQPPAYVFGDAIIRDNEMQYVDAFFEAGFAKYRVQVNGAKLATIRNNIIASAATTTPGDTLRNRRCGTVNYFNNKTPGGVLVQGWNPDTSRKYDELETEAEDAFVLAFLER